jgi:serine protease inhibitor
MSDRQTLVMSPYRLILLILAIGFFSCHKNVDPPAVSKTLVLPANGDKVIAASNQFAFKFFAADLIGNPDAVNRLISPLSIYTALSMVYNGAAGTTRDSIAKALQLNGISIDDLNALNRALITQMPKEDSKVTISIANSIWSNTQQPQPQPSFLTTLLNNYDGFIASLDFTNPRAADRINSWVAQKTNNKILSILQHTDPTDLMYLLNAVYFNGAWQFAFKTTDTHNGTFYLSNGQTIATPFMNQQVSIRAAVTPSFIMAELPYGTGKGYDMYVAAPTDIHQPIAAFASSFDEAALTAALSKLDTASYQLSLPKWEYNYSIMDMTPHLSSLGMGIAFKEPDFSNMYQNAKGLAITSAIHKTYIKVSEQGTEAAAVTAIGIGLTAFPSHPALVFNHPFLYIIREKQTGAILFIGIVTDPSG